MPSRIMLQRKLAAHTTQPQPPSGGEGVSRSSSSIQSSSSPPFSSRICLHVDIDIVDILCVDI